MHLGALLVSPRSGRCASLAYRRLGALPLSLRPLSASAAARACVVPVLSAAFSFFFFSLLGTSPPPRAGVPCCCRVIAEPQCAVPNYCIGCVGYLGAVVAIALKCRRRFFAVVVGKPRSVPCQGGASLLPPAPCALLWCGARGGGCGALRTTERGFK